MHVHMIQSPARQRESHPPTHPPTRATRSNPHPSSAALHVYGYLGLTSLYLHEHTLAGDQVADKARSSGQETGPRFDRRVCGPSLF